jgi:hypothetical protein
MLTQEQLKEILHYDPESGIFRWRKSVARCIKPWDVAGTDVHGYVVIEIKAKPHAAHRLAWLYMTGSLPQVQVDHEDRVRSNNSWSNLREATHKQNMENKPIYKNNSSGYRGVCWCKRNEKWAAKLSHNKKNIHVGYFDDAKEAAQAVAERRSKLFTHDTGRDQVNFARFE